MLAFICLLVAIMGFMFNGYKFAYIADEPYPIYPWSTFPQRAKTTPVWLGYHLWTALMLLIVSTMKLFIPDNYGLHIIRMGFHYLFLMGVIPNIFNLGNAPSWLAFLVNGISVLVLQWCLYWNYYYGYFWVLVVPIIIETIARIGNMIVCH